MTALDRLVKERPVPAVDRPRRPDCVWILLVLLVIQGLGGLAGGLSLTIFVVSLLKPVRRFCGVGLPGEA